MARLGRNGNISEGDLRALHHDVSQWAMYCTGFDHDLAREVVQQSYLKIVEGTAFFGGRSTLKTWIFGVVRLTAQELKRKQHSFVALDDPETGMPPEVDTEGEGYGDAPEPVELDKALRELSLVQREVAYLVFYRDLSLSEVSEILGVSIGTVRKQYHRAKYRLAELLGIGAEEYGNGTIIEKTVS